MPVDIMLVHFDDDPVDSVGAAGLHFEKFFAIRNVVFDACRRHGPATPGRWLGRRARPEWEPDVDRAEAWYFVGDAVGGTERVIEVELLRPEAATVAWVADVSAALAQIPAGWFTSGTCRGRA
jgi:hypothetical protein